MGGTGCFGPADIGECLLWRNESFCRNQSSNRTFIAGPSAPFAVAAMCKSSHSPDCRQGQMLLICDGSGGCVGQQSFKVGFVLGFKLNVCECLRIPGRINHKRCQRHIPINPQIAYT